MTQSQVLDVHSRYWAVGMAIAVAIMLTFAVHASSARAAAAVNIGHGDTAVIYSTSETRSINAHMPLIRSNNGKPIICAYTFINVQSGLCKTLKAIGYVRWWQARWFFYNAVQWGACGVWVVDTAWWRSPIIRAAYDKTTGLADPWVSVGTTDTIESGNSPGYAYLTCGG